MVSSREILACPLVATTARQDRSGGLQNIRVDVDATADLTAGQARELAGHLIHAAGIAEQWAETADTTSRLATAKAAAMDAYIALRGLPGNAGDYLRAALDSISDAQAVVR
ncbi:hypothetical protein A5661_26390 [Mycobacterium asiaticum]|nr:hypothetical protein A5661_26390 [Mycobacterium asiaticum]